MNSNTLAPIAGARLSCLTNKRPGPVGASPSGSEHKVYIVRPSIQSAVTKSQCISHAMSCLIISLVAEM